MISFPSRGNLSEFSFPLLLSALWKTKGMGRMRLSRSGGEKIIDVTEGQVIATRDSIDLHQFWRFVSTREGALGIDVSTLGTGSSWLKHLNEQNLMPPYRLWELMEQFCKDSLFALFDWSEGDYVFETGLSLKDEREILFLIPCLDILWEGVGRMQNFDLMTASLPLEAGEIQLISTRVLDEISLAPSEYYLLRIIKRTPRLKEIYESSELGERETRRLIFRFILVGALGFRGKDQDIIRTPSPPPLDLAQILTDFNNKCSFIHKYISKEIGPVAQNILENCLDETKGLLPPVFAKIKIGKDGRLNIHSLLKSNTQLSSAETRQMLLSGLNDILVAEVLAVKKTLGNEHESMLLQNLKKAGR